jgi:hypothetical protein
MQKAQPVNSGWVDALISSLSGRALRDFASCPADTNLSGSETLLLNLFGHWD